MVRRKTRSYIYLFIGIILLILICLLFWLSFHSCQTQKQHPVKHDPEFAITSSGGLDIPVYHYKKNRDTVLNHTGYTVSYNKDWKLPNWISYELTRNKTTGNEKRKSNFRINPHLKNVSATNADYSNSGYDKGHMVPAADMKWSKTAMEESFYFSNICPQHPELNRKRWKELEEKVRHWASRDSAVIVICGPIVKNEAKYIGNNKIVIPEAFFKVILSPYGDEPLAIGFLFDNKTATRELFSYAVTVDSVEAVTGMDFFSSLPDELENRIEASIDTNLWNRTH